MEKPSVYFFGDSRFNEGELSPERKRKKFYGEIAVYFDRNERQPWRDIMQVCLNGHVINDGYQNHPQYNKDFCTKCGEKTITQCPKCNNPIPGKMQDTGVAVIGFPPSAPEFCQHCGEKFPWAQKKESSSQLIKEKEAIEELQNLFSKFHRIAKVLRKRHDNRATLDIRHVPKLTYCF